MVARSHRRFVAAWIAISCLVLPAACGASEPTTTPQASTGATYVALGDSSVAGAGIGPTSGACLRSEQNYPSLIAEEFGLTGRQFVDRSCPGATTSHVLKGRTRDPELPPQVNALGQSTQVVTISIGGNDFGYIPSLFAYCYLPPTSSPSACKKTIDFLPSALSDITTNVAKTLKEIRRRAPAAQVVLVSYLRLAPDDGLCADTAMRATPADIRAGAAAEGQLEVAMRSAAEETKVDYVSMRALSANHSACAGPDAWTSGITAAPGDGSPLHPRASGMAAVARAVEPVVSARLQDVK